MCQLTMYVHAFPALVIFDDNSIMDLNHVLVED